MLIDFNDWRKQARQHLQAGEPPERVRWESGNAHQPGLFDEVPAEVSEGSAPAYQRVSRVFINYARLAAQYRSPDRWDLLYRILWRLTHGEPHLMQVDTDQDVMMLRHRAGDVRRDCHKMKAFVRFKALQFEDTELYVAWFEPRNLILPLMGKFFTDRFANMRWQILTPDGSLNWNGSELQFDPTPCSNPALADDFDEIWKIYYRSTFNPARLKIRAMKQEMPVYYWKNLPEAELINELIRDSGQRVQSMLQHSDD